MLLYSLLADSRLCSITALSRMLEPAREQTGTVSGRLQPEFPVGSSGSPSAVVAFWWGISMAANSCSWLPLMMRSRYIFSRIPYVASCWQRSSLKRVANIRERCWPGTNHFGMRQISTSLTGQLLSIIFLPVGTRDTSDTNAYLQKPVWCSLGHVSGPLSVHFHGQSFYKTVRCISAQPRWISFWSQGLWHSTPRAHCLQ